MFAIALWDSRERKLLLARDRVGKKPLFYDADGKQILFGSELKALLAADSSCRATSIPRPSAITSPLATFPRRRRFIDRCENFCPGHYLVASGKGVREVCYWDLSFAVTEERTEEEWCELIAARSLRSYASTLDERRSAGRVSQRRSRLFVDRRDDEPIDESAGHDVLDWV